MPLTTGQVLHQRYRIVKLLGQGGMGAIYRVWDIHLNRPYALKENFETAEEGQRQFSREATILAHLKHPNLPRVMDHFSQADARGAVIAQYLVMDFIEGQDLQELLDSRTGPFSEAEILTWMVQVCDALDYLHNQQPPIIHRDLKPANIRITPQGQAILVDFGIAKAYEKGRLTTRGAKAVTPGYSPIEQYGGGGMTDARTDLYALGATIYALLTGHEPPECTERVVQDSLLPARQLNPAISPAVQALLSRALQIDPARRFQSARTFKEALLSATRAPVAQPSAVNQGAVVRPTQQASGAARVVAPAAGAGTFRPGSRFSPPRLIRYLVFSVLGLLGVALVSGLLIKGLVVEVPTVAPALVEAFMASETVRALGGVPSAPPTGTEEPAPAKPTPTLTFTPQPTRRIETVKVLPNQPFESGTFAMLSEHSGLCLDVPYGTQQDVQLIQYGCHYGLNQAWLFVSKEAGSFEVASVVSGKCLEVHPAGSGPADQIYQAACDGGPNQRWLIDVLEGGAYQLKARHNYKCLDILDAGMSDNQLIVQNSCNGLASQRWVLQPIPLTLDTNKPPLLEGIFTLTSVYSEQCLEVPGGVSQDTQLTRSTCTGDSNQHWHFSHQGNTNYLVNAQVSGSCLDVYNAGTSEGEMIYQAGCHAGDNQVWEVRPYADGSYQLRALHSWKCLAMQEDSSAIVQQTCSGGEMQRWRVASPPSFSFDLRADSYPGLTLRVLAGQRLTINASGTVNTNPDYLDEPCNQWVGPSGLADCRYVDEKPSLMNLPFMGLIGWFQYQWSLFGEYTVRDILQDSWVILTHNDDYFADNDGLTLIDVTLQGP